MLLSEIKSRPLYGRLSPDPQARRHVAAVEAEGAQAVIEAFSGQTEPLAQLTIVAAPGSSKAHAPGLAALGADALHALPSAETALIRLKGLLSTAAMGTRLYVSGPESFVSQAIMVAMAQGFDHASIQTEHRGSLARRVQCVHCKGFMESVTESPVRCAHCGIALLVRDHYSRRLGAFMGVSIDAEAPGEVPAPEAFA